MKYFVILFLVTQCITAQQPVNLQLTEKDGLPDKELYGVKEDSKGFIWLAGNKGLTRFDGKNYTSFTHPEKRGLSVFELFIDKSDRVWCINITGQIFYVEGNKLILFKDLKTQLKGTLPELLVHENHVVISSYLFIQVINMDGETIFSRDRASDMRISKNCFVFNDSLYFQLNEGLYLFENNDLSLVVEFDKNLEQFEYKQRYINQATAIDNDRILFISQKGVNDLKFTVLYKNQFKSIRTPEILSEVKVDKFKVIDSQLFLATSQGVFLFELVNEELIFSKSFLSDYFATDVLKDMDNNYWVTTLSNGAFILPNLYIQEIALAENCGRPKELELDNYGNLYIGTTSGKGFKYTIKDAQVSELTLNGNRSVAEILYDPYRDQISFFQDVESTTLDRSNKQVKPIIKYVSLKSARFVSRDSIMLVNSQFASVVPVYSKDNYRNTYKALYVKRGYTSYYNTKKDYRYFGMFDELIKRSADGKETVIKDTTGKDILANSIAMDKDNHLWIGTFNSGLYELNDDRVVKKWDTSNGLLSNNINTIKLDDDYVWISTDNGIQRLSIDRSKFKNLTSQDGIPSYTVTDIEIIGDHVFFASSESLFKIHKEKAFKSFAPIDIYFTQVEINDKNVDLNNSYEMARDASSIKIYFNSNGLRAMTSGIYEYRIKNLNDNWLTIPTGTNAVSLPSLPKGNYIFQLRASNLEGKTYSLKELNLKITTPFYQSVWFIVCVSTLIVAGIVIYYRRKLRFRESEKNKQLEYLKKERELALLKLENLRSQMNPHFVFNALNSIQEYIMKNERELAGDYLGKFADLIRTYLDHSVKGSISLQEEMDSLHMYLELEKLRFEELLHYEITCNMDNIADAIFIPTMLIQPYVENALKHGLLHIDGERELFINFTLESRKKLLVCTIDDNGIGRVRAKEMQAKRMRLHRSFSTQATDDRISLLSYVLEKQASIDIIDKYDGDSATGTLVKITIPYTTDS